VFDSPSDMNFIDCSERHDCNILISVNLNKYEVLILKHTIRISMYYVRSLSHQKCGRFGRDFREEVENNPNTKNAANSASFFVSKMGEKMEVKHEKHRGYMRSTTIYDRDDTIKFVT
jgi:hypothetical protein